MNLGAVQNKNLGAIERQPSGQDFPISATLITTTRPTTLGAGMSWFKRNYQGQLPFCGPHAGSHNKAIQDHRFNPNWASRYTPRYNATRMKDPTDPLYDGYPVDAGTDMRSLFRSFQIPGGADEFEPLENDVSLPIEQYTDPMAITQDMDRVASQSLIKSYAFDLTPGGPTYDSIADALWAWRSEILLIKCDDGFWGTKYPTFTNPLYGHFITAYDWDDSKGGLWIVDSADPSDAMAFKFISAEYINPEFFYEAGTTVDIPPAAHQALLEGKLDIAKMIIVEAQKAINKLKVANP